MLLYGCEEVIISDYPRLLIGLNGVAHAFGLVPLGGLLMYRRLSSDRFMVLTNLGIVTVMAIFTWVMYRVAQPVLTTFDFSC